MTETKLLSIREAAEILGISVHTLYEWVRQRRIAFVKCGRRTLIDVQDVKAYIRKHRVAELPL